MSNMLFLLGHQPELSVAELNQLGIFGEILANSWYRVENYQNQSFSKLQEKLGGTIKIAKESSSFPSSLDFEDRKNFSKVIPEFIQKAKNLGLSIYGNEKQKKSIFNLFKKIEKVFAGKIFFERNTFTLPTKKVFSLLQDGVKEINLILSKETVTVSETIAVQNSNSYEKRDLGRPNLLKKTGMMPLKLTQMLINLAGGSDKLKKIIDPFCGAGTILQEAIIQNINAYGIDIDPRTVSLAQDNLNWLVKQKISKSIGVFQIKHGNAIDQNIYRKFNVNFDAVVSEGELGKNFTRIPSDEQINQQIRELSPLFLRSFRAFSSFLTNKGKVVICFPFWLREKNDPLYLSKNILEQVKSFGFKEINLTSEDKKGLCYKRPKQFVGREIFVFEKLK